MSKTTTPTTTTFGTELTSAAVDKAVAAHFIAWVVQELDDETAGSVYPWPTVALHGIAETVYKTAKSLGHSKADADELRRVVYFVGDSREAALEVLLEADLAGDGLRLGARDLLTVMVMYYRQEP